MKTSMNNTESKTDSNTQEATQTNEATPNVDELGYEIEEGQETANSDESPTDDNSESEEEKVEKPATGYGKEEESETEEPVDDKPVEKEEPADETDEAKLKKEISEKINTLPESFDKIKVSKFIEDNKFTKEQVEAYVKLVKDDEIEFQKAQKEAIKTQRNNWQKELKTDPEFGGENFDKNLDRVEKLLEKHLPNTKKVLTEKASMLPPYVMKDFLALAKTLNPTTKLVTGEPAEVKKDDTDFLDEMYE